MNFILFQYFNLSLELLILLITSMVAILLALIVYFSNPKSATNKIFFLLTLSTLIWLVIGYMLRQPNLSFSPLLLERLAIFFAAPISSLFFLLASTLPAEKIGITKRSFLIVISVTILMMALNISPYGFVSGDVVNGVISPKPGVGFIPFALISTLFCVLALHVLIKRMKRSSAREEKQQFKIIFGGILIMLLLIIVTVLIPIIIFQSGLFVPLAPIYTLFFFGATTYAIVKHKLFNLKVIATESLTVVLWILLLSKIFTTENISARVIDSLIFLATVFFGILLIRSVRREVEQREKLEKITKDLEAANEKLKELDNLKSEFLSFASHQIKSPMAVVKGFAELIYDGSYGPIPDKAKEAAGRIKEAVDRLLALVKNFLDLRKIEQGKMEYNFEVVTIVDVIKHMGDDLSILVKKKNLEYKFEASDAELKVRIDVQRFTQVIQNIIDNSIKYTDTGWIKVSVKKQDADALVCVSDSGRGMSKEMLGKLFGQFSRDSEAAKAKEGTGLGLFIAKQIVLAHQGEIWAESDGEGKGSRFCVKLPLYTGK